MAYHPVNHHRHSIRLSEYNYAQAGAYFVTICTHDRQCLFSKRRHDPNILNPAGMMLHDWYNRLEKQFPVIHCDAFVAMPNHVHFIILVRKEAEKPTLPALVQWFKTMTTNKYIQGVKESGWKPFSKKLWQRGYYERVIRDEDELLAMREYILANPAKWLLDPYNHSL